MGHLPSGMELFPAANEDQWTLIKKIIDDCDYYIVIIAGRYGSLDSDGYSYTEKEYRYALEKGKPVMAFLRENPEELSSFLTEQVLESQRKLTTFRKLVQERTCKYWKESGDLSSAVILSLNAMTQNNPGIGWVRGDQMATMQRLNEIISSQERELAYNDFRSAHHALEIEINDFLRKYENGNNNRKISISIDVIAISMVSSWEFLRDKVPGFLDKNKNLTISLRLLWVDPDLLKSISMSEFSEIDWSEVSRSRLEDTKKFLDRNPDCQERLKLQARTYSNLPHWHGILFNEKHLYLGRANWSFPQDGRPRLSCAKNKYRYFDMSSDIGKERINLFDNWFKFYTEFQSKLIYDSSIQHDL
jgi:Domain of unknown function (DUF4062)